MGAGECPAYIKFSDIAVQAAEDAGVVPTNEKDFVALKVEAAIDGIYQHLHGGR